MAVGVNQPNMQRQDPLDQVVKGLQIATSIYGIKADMAKVDLAKQDQKMKQDAAARETTTFQQGQDKVAHDLAGEILPANAAAMTKDHIISETPIPGGQKLTVLYPEGKKDIWVATKTKELDPLTEELKRQRLQEGKDKSDEKKNGKIVPATEAVALGTTNAAYQALGDSSKAFETNTDISGPMQGRLSSLLAKGEIGDTGKRAKTFDAQMKVNAQVIGKSLEGGKLTDQDIDRYRSMLPNLNDSPDAAKAKVDVLQNMLAQKQQAEQGALEQAGYNVGKISNSPTKANPNIRSPLQEAVSKNKPPAFTPQDLNSMSDSDLAAIHSQVVKKGKK